ncbi:winged helix-turn-helix transcriptional regulator [Clostridium lundense]|uniref:winged helix-turn-helix transcriptional regulator n=1 Tax=Clostridium lundense TaxID=319475 RepID=UPI000684002E|nr:helix-turn-helix domain-containing protein [Clostridium lundense]
MIKTKKDLYTCGVELTSEILSGKWKLMILWYLRNGNIRFGQLKKSLDGISEKVLSCELKELIQLGIINKKIYYEKPLKVEYSLTHYGISLLPILYSIFEWGTAYAKTFDVKLKISDSTIHKVLNEKINLQDENKKEKSLIS